MPPNMPILKSSKAVHNQGGEKKLCEFCFVTLQIFKYEFMFLDAYHLDALYIIVVELVYERCYLCDIS